MKMKPLTLLLGSAVALGLGYALYHKPARFLGDKARAGDAVTVPASALATALQGVATGSNVVVAVASVQPDTLTGPVVAVMQGALRVALPQPLGPVAVPRAAVTEVVHNGQVVT